MNETIALARDVPQLTRVDLDPWTHERDVIEECRIKVMVISSLPSGGNDRGNQFLAHTSHVLVILGAALLVATSLGSLSLLLQRSTISFAS